MFYILCICMNKARHIPVCCNNEACEFCRCLLWGDNDVLSCSSLRFLITSAYSLGSWTFLKRHSSSLRPAPRTVGFSLQNTLWHLAEGWQRPKAGRGHDIPCCHPINRLLSQLKHRGSRVLSAISLYFECHFVHSRFISAVHASQRKYQTKSC